MLTIAGGIILAIVILVVGGMLAFAVAHGVSAFLEGTGAAFLQSRKKRLELRAKQGEAKAQFELAEMLGPRRPE